MNHDHCQIHYIVPKKRVALVLESKALPLRLKHNINPSPQPFLLNSSDTTNRSNGKDISCKKSLLRTLPYSRHNHDNSSDRSLTLALFQLIPSFNHASSRTIWQEPIFEIFTVAAGNNSYVRPTQSTNE